MRESKIVRFMVVSAFLFLTAVATAETEKPVLRIALISSPYITTLEAKDIKEKSGKSRSWLKARATEGINKAINATNKLKPDVFVVLGSLTWTGSDADFAALKGYLDKLEVPYYVVPGWRDRVEGGLEACKKHFGEKMLDRTSIVLNGVKLQFATNVERGKEAEAVEWMAKDLANERGEKGVLVFDGPVLQAGSPVAKRFYSVMQQEKVAARINSQHGHSVYYEDSLPIWTAPSSGWQNNWALALVSVYPSKVHLELVKAVDQPRQALEVPNPVRAARMTTAQADPYGVPTYSEDLARKPELTFVQLADSQFDDMSEKRRAARYRYAPQMNKVAVEQVNRLQPPFAFMTGDLVNKNTPAEWKTFNDIYSQLKMPLYALPGNHDLLHSEEYRKDPDKLKTLKGTALANWEYADKIAKEGYTGRLALYQKFTKDFASGGKIYYSFEQNGCVFICLDTSQGKVDAEQLVWLEKELERTKAAKHVIMLGHHPLMTKWRHAVGEGGEKIFSLMKKYKVAAYLCGHRHSYGYELYDGTAHVRCDDLCWGENVAYMIYHVFPDRIVACWKPIWRAVGTRPLYERIIFPEPRFNK